MKLLRLLEDILWPQGLCCLGCDELIDDGFLCPNCVEALAAMRLKPHEQGSIRCAYRYEGVAKELVIKLKMECAVEAAELLADAMAEELATMDLPQDTVLTWVTMPKNRFYERGIDHGKTLCEAVSQRCGLPAKQLLERKGHFRTQSGLHKRARLKNLRGTVLCKETIHTPVLLIDDVTTTGTTASVCAEALLAAGAPRVEVLTATRVRHISQEKENRMADLYGLYTC